MKNLFISEILLLSRKERKAKRVQFDRKRTLIHGKNHTGKSSLIKSIYRTFGAEPLMSPRFTDAGVISMVRFEVNGGDYEIVRDDKTFALFDGRGSLLQKFDTVTKGLGLVLANLFDFTPQFEGKSKEFLIPPPAFLFLPYYVDQDESWAKSWSSFRRLEQFKDYRNQSINYHSGLRPNAYYEVKKKLEQYVTVIEDTRKESNLTSRILADVRNKLKTTDFNLDVDAFKEEISQLLAEGQSLKLKEEKTKKELMDLHNIKTTLDAQVVIVKKAILESNRDLKFATAELPPSIDCPTCGAHYDNSFSERFEIARDEASSQELLLDLLREADEVGVQIQKENDTLTKTMSEVVKIDQILQQRKGDLLLKDVIESEGKNQVHVIFNDRLQDLNKKLSENEIERQRLAGQLKSFEDKDRKARIVNDYIRYMEDFLRKLDVTSLQRSDYDSIIKKIENKELGSSRPRTLIAYYFAFFHLMKEHSTSVYCPLIIDSPNQQDQDVEHIDKIMEFINSNQPSESQMILGLAETYDVNFDCQIVELKEKHSLLLSEEYDDVYAIVGKRLSQMWFT